MNIAEHIRIIPDFPKPGILFRDITSLLLDPAIFEETCDQLIEKIKPWNPTVIAAAEARGFVFGAVIALKMRLPFVLLRKPGKLPGKTVSYQYELEYGTNELHVHESDVPAGSRVAFIDDLIAIGGTAEAACKLIEKAGGTPVGCAFVIELVDLGGRAKLAPVPVETLVELHEN